MLTPSYLGITVTLTEKDTAYPLLTLLQAVDSRVSGTCRELSLQVNMASPGNIDIGDAEMTTSRRGRRMLVNDDTTGRGSGERVYTGGGTRTVVAIADKFVMGTVDASVLNVEISM